mgnify:CR=1 FL=1
MSVFGKLKNENENIVSKTYFMFFVGLCNNINSTYKKYSNGYINIVPVPKSNLKEVKDYDNLIVIDSIKTGKMEPGEVVEIMENQNASSRMLSSHDVSFFEMLKMGKVLGLKMPQNVKIYGIEIKDNETFSEELTDELKEKLPEIINKIYLANRENLQ